VGENNDQSGEFTYLNVEVKVFAASRLNAREKIGGKSEF